MKPDDLQSIVRPIHQLLVNTANSNLVDSLAYDYPGMSQYSFTESDVNNAIDSIFALSGQDTFSDVFMSVYSTILEEMLADLEAAGDALALGGSQVQGELKLLLPETFDLITIVDFFSTAYPGQEAFADQIINSPVVSEGDVDMGENDAAEEMPFAAASIEDVVTMVPTMMPSSNVTMQPTPASSTNTTTSPPGLDPSSKPSASPSSRLSSLPSGEPSPSPSSKLSGDSRDPSGKPSASPSSWPSFLPSGEPSPLPSSKLSGESSNVTSSDPSSQPSVQSMGGPTPLPSTMPSGKPSSEPSSFPSSQQRRSLQAFTEESFGESADIALLRCTFADNSVTGSVVSGDGGRLDVIDSNFDNNEALDSMVASFRGMISVERSCFRDNVHDAANGVVFVGTDAFMGERVDNYGSGNSADKVLGGGLPSSEVCNAILVKEGVSCGILPSESCRDRCIPFDSDTCLASTGGGGKPKGICSTDANTEGYSDLSSLQRALDESTADGTGEATTFVLCPFTTYSFIDELRRPLDPIRIERSNVKIQCGADGASTNGCIFAGGSRHLEIYNGSLDVVIQGLRFVGSTEVSVTVDGSDSATSASFIDSHWQENEGTESLLILGPGMGEGPLPNPPGRDDSIGPTPSPTIGDDDALFPPDDDAVVPTASPTKRGDDDDDGADDDLPTDDFFTFEGRYLQEEECGSKVCGAGEYCCNKSCSICAPVGDFCIMLECSGAGVSVQVLGGSSFVVSNVCSILRACPRCICHCLILTHTPNAFFRSLSPLFLLGPL